MLEAGRAYCVPKAVLLAAVLLAAVLRAAGVPARLGFADVRNHVQSDTLRAPSWVARTCSCTTATAASTSTDDG